MLLDLKASLTEQLRKVDKVDKSIEGKIVKMIKEGNTAKDSFTLHKIVEDPELSSSLTQQITFLNGFLSNSITGITIGKFYNNLEALVSCLESCTEEDEEGTFNLNIAQIFSYVDKDTLKYKVLVYKKMTDEECVEYTKKLEQKPEAKKWVHQTNIPGTKLILGLLLKEPVEIKSSHMGKVRKTSWLMVLERKVSETYQTYTHLCSLTIKHSAFNLKDESLILFTS